MQWLELWFEKNSKKKTSKSDSTECNVQQQRRLITSCETSEAIVIGRGSSTCSCLLFRSTYAATTDLQNRLATRCNWCVRSRASSSTLVLVEWSILLLQPTLCVVRVGTKMFVQHVKLPRQVGRGYRSLSPLRVRRASRRVRPTPLPQPIFLQKSCYLGVKKTR